MKFSPVKTKQKTIKRRFVRTVPRSLVAHKSKTTTNLAGGQAFTMDERLEVISLMATSFVENKFYETQKQQCERLKALIGKDPVFAAKAALYVRTQCGMRSITHITAGEIAHLVKGVSWTRDFFDKVVYRLDDAIEILAYYLGQYSKPIPNSLKKGLGRALGRFDEYSFAKYKGEGHEITLVDLVNLIHPTPTARNRSALRKLIKGELKNTETWEAQLSQAGSDTELKAEAWKDLLKENELGYFALLKNLRNIMQQADSKALKLALTQLVDETQIKKSLVMPFRFVNAYDQIEATGHIEAGQVLAAISKACEIATQNVPRFEGDTVVVIDDSGSMVSGNVQSGRTPAQNAALFGSILLRANPTAHLVVFNDHARYVTVDPSKSLIALKKEIEQKFQSGGTNFNSIFPVLRKAYDRVIVMSDMQGWIRGTPGPSVAQYKKKFGCDPRIYSFDLNGYGSLQFPEQNVYAVAGFSDKVFNVMGLLEKDRQALINEIEAIKL
jgi:60 kDa SS-A/Ro ribonucleoprotein